jgi:HAE1 family hydrophobic/amphiphilic exporter-1
MARFFIDRPVMAMVISILFVIAGAVAAATLPVEQYPNLAPPQIVLNGTYPGADAVTVEQAVATPIEQQMNGVEKMTYLQSTNASDGTMQLRVTFDISSDSNIDNVLAQNRLSQAMPFIPQDVRDIGITVKKSTSAPLLVFSLFADGDRYTPEFLSNYATINIQDPLLRLPGVGDFKVFGASNYAMRIWVKPEKLSQLGLTVGDLEQAIKAQNVVNPSGQIGGEPAPPGQQLTKNARAQGRLITPEEFGRIVVRALPDGSLVRLSDVARIDLGTESYTQKARLDGRPAAVFAIYQTPGSNALALAKAAKEALAGLQQKFPEGLKWIVSLDTTLPITEGIDEILHTLVEALVLVILVVFLFLQTFRATLIPLLTVPVSLIGVFVFFPMLGFTLNTLSLFGLVLAIGLVVDDAIVVVEAVTHHIEQGMAPKAATVQAMKEVQGPVVGIALILSSVFVPMAFVSGITGRMYQQFAATIALSVLISAFNALTLSPALCALLLRRTEKTSRGPLRWFFDKFERGYGATHRAYTAAIRGLLRKSVFAFGFVALFTLLAGGLAKATPTAFVPEEDQGYLYLDMLLPPAASQQRSDAFSKQVEEIVRKQEEVEHANTIVGYSLLSSTAGPNVGFMFIALKDWKERQGEEHQADAVMRRINRQLAALPGGTAIAFSPPAIPGVGNSGGFDLMLQDRGEHTPQWLEAQGKKFIAAARQHPEIGSVNMIYSGSDPQLFFEVDRDQVLKQGASISDVYGTLQAFLGGAYVNDFTRFGRQWKVYLQAEPEARGNVEALSLFSIRNRDGATIPITSVLKVKDTVGPRFTSRFNLYRSAQITGAVAPGYSSGQAMKVLEEVAREAVPEMGFSWNNLSYQEAVASSGLGALLLAVVLVFLVLAAMYESWSLPWSVLLGTPLAVVGAYLGLELRAFPSDVFAQIGTVMLVGLAAKNAILIVEYARAQHQAGRPLQEAAVHASDLRLRPILMTALAFGLGCVPLWIASGSGAISRRELGTVVIMGTVIATVLGVFLTPMLFVVVEGWATRRRERRAKKAAPAAGGDALGPHPVGSER